MEIDAVARAVVDILEKVYVADLQRIAIDSSGDRGEDAELRTSAAWSIRTLATEFTNKTGIALNLEFLTREYWNE